MKKIKKLSVLLGMCLLLVATILPMGAWTTAAAADSLKPEEEALTETDNEFWGNKAITLNFSGGGYILFDFVLKNRIWPAHDNLVLTITSDTVEAYYGFILKFVWTNGSGGPATWIYPDAYSTVNHVLTQIEPDGSRGGRDVHDINCNSKYLIGSPGQRWACERIDVTITGRIRNQPEQNTGLYIIHFN